MGFLRKLFGGEDEKDKDAPRRPAPPRRAPPAEPPRREPPAPPPGPAAEGGAPEPAAGTDVKALTRQLGAPSAEARVKAARRLAEMGDRTAMRPLINAYLNYGDPPLLEALAAYRQLVGTAAIREASDLGVIGERRARIMDILGLSDDPDVAPVLRDNLADRDAMIRVAAARGLAQIGDQRGVDELAHDLQVTDADLRSRALDALAGLDMKTAREAIQAHVERYLGEAGAVPEKIAVRAPRLAAPDTSLSEYATDEIKRAPHALTVLIGSEATRLATTRRDELRRDLPGYELRVTTPQHAPEEQIAALLDARDLAAAGETRVVFVGPLPAPHDRLPLPHFLTATGGGFTAKVMALDPHEYNLLMDWWHYVDDKAEVPTDFEVILPISTPDRSAISNEEHRIYELTPDARKDAFLRAYLAHL